MLNESKIAAKRDTDELFGYPDGDKVSELDVLVGTLRPEVQQSYQSYKAEALLLKLTQDERLQEIAEKVQAVTDEVANAVDLIMRQMLRALLFTEKMTQK
ncbi:hypothetical protein NECAME_09381 [Necator americanus]|uniref:Uncharacterized protein n=1 Tax=Necator americanus TaxID=51031 RepID=W2TDL0_NECAM|nr:hypothetical protein NECAME_09381 [Necator americanus]ETN80145.1 hypothetical protein NECAME_09381 [Necator americanus]